MSDKKSQNNIGGLNRLLRAVESSFLIPSPLNQIPEKFTLDGKDLR